jgi:putative DNA primase/helicase
MGWAKDHLPEMERAAIARDCFQAQPGDSGEIHGLCPAHDEKEPSFSYNIAKDICNCFSCGFTGDLVTLWCHSEGIGDKTAGFKAFVAKFGNPDTAGSGQTSKKNAARAAGRGEAAAEPETTLIISDDVWESMELLPDLWIQTAGNKWTWSDETVRSLGLRLWKARQGNERRIAIPIRINGGALVNIRLYLPGASANKLRSWKKEYGKSKLFPAPDAWLPGPLLICEGEKDTITALSHGFNAVTQTAGCNSWDDKFTRFFAGRDVVIVYDADEKGVKGAQKVAAKLAGTAGSVRVLVWPEFMGMVPDHGQDLTNWFADHKRSAQQLRDLIAVAPVHGRAAVADDSAMPASVHRFFGGKKGTQFKPRLVADEILTWRYLIYDAKSGVFFTWNDRFFEEYDAANIRRYVLDLLQIEGTTPRVNDVLGLVRDLSIIQHGRTMNDRSNFIPLLSGMFCVETAEVTQHSPDNYNTYCLDIDYSPKAKQPDCPTWKNFLQESVNDAATVVELQKFFGYCYTRETRHEKALLLIGPGGDGKGTILKVLQSLLGEINVANVSMGGLEDQFHRVMLVDKLLNVTTEVEAGLLQSDIFKAIVSGEAVSAAYKHKNAFNFQPVCKMAFSANKHPNIQDTSDGLYRRLLIIEMAQQFVGKGKADLYLYEKLMQEKAGIFLWGLRGLQLLNQNGFRPSEYMNECLDNYKELNNPVIAFVNTHVEVYRHDDMWECTMTVYDKYVKFCNRRNYRALAESRFGVELRKAAKGIEKTRQSRGARKWGYKYLRLVDDYALSS